MSKSNHSKTSVSRKFQNSDSSQHVILSSSQSFVSPLPPPEVLEAYERNLPGITERILASFEKEGEHRRSSDKFQQELVREYHQNHARLTSRGQICGMIVVILGLSVAAFLGWAGKQVVAGIIAALDLVGLASVFLYHEHIKKENAKENDT